MDLLILNFIFPNNGWIINAIGGILFSILLIMAYLQHKYLKDLSIQNLEANINELKRIKYYRNNFLIAALFLYIILHIINFF